jgi:hypothetical protein
MFDFFKKLTGSKTGVETPTITPKAAAAPNSQTNQIQFQPDLIDHLVADHRRLLEVYGEIKTAFDAADYKQVSQGLDELRRNLQGHLLTENVRMYIYLDRHLANNEFNSELIRGFRREMDAIGKVAMTFLKKYEAIGVDNELAGAFAKDFETIGSVLVKRIEKEERDLYPLYMPHY